MRRLQTLARRAAKGDPEAAAAVRRELEAQLTRIVRRVMRTGAEDSAVARRILAEAQRTNPEGGEPQVAEVSRRMCQSVLEGLQPALAAKPRPEEGPRS